MVCQVPVCARRNLRQCLYHSTAPSWFKIDDSCVDKDEFMSYGAILHLSIDLVNLSTLTIGSITITFLLVLAIDYAM
jgi:hypothetical protein